MLLASAGSPRQPPAPTEVESPSHDDPPAPSSGSGECPQLKQFDPALTSLSTDELQRQLRGLRTVLPSIVDRQLLTMKTMEEGYAPEQRECMAKANLVSILLSMRVMAKTEPSAWVHALEPEQLRELLRTRKLLHDWSKAEREDVLAQIEANQIEQISGPPKDRDYWRRTYLGLAVSCELTDGELERIHGVRAARCGPYAPQVK